VSGRTVAALAAWTVVGGCAVGPNFKTPPPPAIDRYTRDALPTSTAAAETEPQRFVADLDIPALWWGVFHSAALDELIAQALAHSPTIDGARAALRQANELAAAQRGSLYPAVSAGYSLSRQKNAVGTLAPTLTSGEELFTLHTAQVSVSYLLDPLGGTRRRVESQQALADAQRFELEAAYLALASNIVAAAITEASLRAEIDANQAIVASEHEALGILERQSALGAIAELDVMAERSQLAATEAMLPPLQKQLAQQRHLLATLVGRFPSEEPTEQFDFAAMALPRDLPVSVPARLVRQRPDVLAAEAQLHAATADVGVAVADLLPQLTLTAAAGGTSTSIEQLFAAGNTFWSAGASLTQTLFQGGTLWHQKLAAEAGLDQAGAQYRGVVLGACQQVADALRALELDAQAVEASARAERAATETLTVTRHNVELGSTSYLSLLSAQQLYLQAVLNSVTARTSRYADTAALFEALGGGWWNRRDGSSDPTGTVR
jgi:NodT family efflux transporter outer membrane factor (OMF) lipoprotein